MSIKTTIVSVCTFLLYCCSFYPVYAQTQRVKNDVKARSVRFGNSKISMVLDYNNKASISMLRVAGQKVIEGDDGIFSEIKTTKETFSTRQLLEQPHVHVTANSITLSNIVYGNKTNAIREQWKFTIGTNDIIFDVDRTLSKSLQVEEAALPVFLFNHINTWEGAFQGHGGLAWFYLFNERLATYGVHTNTSRFWNSKTGNGLSVSVKEGAGEVAVKYTRTAEDKLAYHITVSDKEMIPRHDSGTNRKRFIRQRTDVWSPFFIKAGKTTNRIVLSYFNFNEQYGRGKFKGLNGEQVSAVLNTIARIGVIDRKHFGGNSWHTPYGPICLHEQYIAQLGLAINDEAYLKGYEECLDFYRDNAIKPDGRVWARWAYNNVDIMPGQVTDKGFYEAQWGFLLDSNPDLVTNVAELYDQTGNKTWVKSHQRSCEKALDWMIGRDSDRDGLVEMMTDSHRQQRGSDWIDIIWAAYENAFVNAKLYYALVKWAAIERQLGNTAKAVQYQTFAAKLRSSFNKTTAEGGFWDEEKRCYVHWLDKDKSVHGRNMVTPVNFMAIAYGIIDNDDRRRIILDDIETQMQKENLFFWPLTLYSYEIGEGKEEQFPFPFYENGDLFLSWGSVAVKAYAEYKPELALKYVRNVMARHSQDGLAYQRYGRKAQEGLGDDILSGNSLSVVGLYQSIYGINPLYNRFYLNPHITAELAGTELNYNFRGQKLKILLETGRYSVANSRFRVVAATDFGFYAKGSGLSWFAGNRSTESLKVKTNGKNLVTLDMLRWNSKEAAWIQSGGNGSQVLTYSINERKAGAFYTISVNGKKHSRVKAGATGNVTYIHKTKTGKDLISISKG